MPDRTPGLRERLADAIRAAAHWCGPDCIDEDGEPDCTAHPARTVYAETETDGVLWNVSGAVTALADAVLPVVEAETAALRERAEQAVEALLNAQEAMLQGWAEAAPPGQHLSDRQQELWRNLHEKADDLRAALEPPKETP